MGNEKTSQLSVRNSQNIEKYGVKNPVFNKDPQIQWRPKEKRKGIVEIRYENSIKSRYFKTKLTKMPNLTYFRIFNQNREMKILSETMIISFLSERRKKAGRQESRKERTFCQVKYFVTKI